MKRSTFLRLIGFGSAAAIYRPTWSMGAIDYNFDGTPAGLRPYLQTPRPDSMWVSWWTDADTQSHVDYGLTSGNLNQTTSGSVNQMGTNYHYHTVQLTGLQPNTYYHYRVRTENETSAVFRFRTPKAIGTSTGKYRVLVIGDNQILSSERRYERLVERAKKKCEDMYSGPVEEVIDLIIMPGDQVDVGTLNHYRHLHFKYNGWISPYVPIMTSIGNHETYSDPGLANYKAIFKYDNLSCVGVNSPDPEIYYAYQLANIAFVHTSSEHTSGNTQTNWVQSLVTAADADSDVDWMISLCHRPYQAEQYIGDISSWMRNTAMPIFAQTNKHVLNIGAHHHIYARGQTPDWPVYHIISGGSSWDQYWGQSNEADYDDVQKTIPNWAWQVLEFDLDNKTMDAKCFAEANVRFPSATRWSYNSKLIDQFHRKLTQAAPNTPSLTNSITSPVTLPLTLQSSAFSGVTGETLNTTQFQIAEDAAFTSLSVNKTRHFENIYGDTGSPNYDPIDTHASVDISQYLIAANQLPNGTHYARVRHRDANAEWSEWSAALTFEVTGSSGTGNPSISLAKKIYAPNEDIPIVYANGPGNSTDWIGIYEKGQTPGGPVSTSWQYVNGPGGTITISTNLTSGKEWFAAFFENDGYTEIAPRVPFYVGNQPTLSTNKSAYNEGETAQVSFSNAPAGLQDWIAIYKAGKTPGTDAFVTWQYLNGTQSAPTTGITNGQLNFAGLAKGYYFATYLVNGGYFEIADRVVFSVGDDISSVSMTSATVSEGDDFTVNFTDGPGTPKDWMGIFKKGETPGVDTLTAYLYVDGNTDGNVTFQLPDLAPGEYFVALFTNDSYTEVSPRLDFTVVPFEITSSSANGSDLTVSWKSVAGQQYVVQKSTTMAANSWSDVKTVTGTGNPMQETVSAALGEKRFFVRISKVSP
ncbi:MAG: fibronectin type III domain-containing protein [Akkermansiaceae bacterium]